MQRQSIQGYSIVILFLSSFLVFFSSNHLCLAQSTKGSEITLTELTDVCIGSKDAPVTVVEYSSLNCRHCAAFHSTVLPKIKEKYIDSGKVRLIFRHFPINRAALHAAVIVASIPADRQYEVVAKVFQNQDKCFGKNSLNELTQIAGISESEGKVCLKNQKLQEAVLTQRLVAQQKYNVDGAPTFFVDGQKFSGFLPLDAIDKALASAQSERIITR